MNTATKTIKELIEDYITYLQVERNCPATTQRAYRKDLEQLDIFLLGQAVNMITHSDLRCWMEFLHERYAPSTIGRKLGCVRSFFRFGVREGWVTGNPAKDLDIPRRDETLPKVLTENESETLIESVKAPRDRALLEVLYGGGLRVSEAVGANIEDLGEDHIRVFGKGGRERICPLGRPAMEALRAYLTDRKSGAIFLNYKGTRLTARSARRIVEKCGLENVTPHTLRHSYATNMLDRGIDIRSLQELLGHKSIHSTQRYAQVSNTHKQEVYRKFHPRG